MNKIQKKKERERTVVYKTGNKEVKIVLEEKEKEDLEKKKKGVFCKKLAP